MPRIYYANEAEPEEQGGFCDRASGIHYCNESKDDTLDKAAVAEEFGDSASVRCKDIQADPNDLPAETRFNTTRLETDELGFEYPAKYEPGR